MRRWIVIASLMSSICINTSLNAKWRQYMAQVFTPQEQEWFYNQKIPGTNNRCCSVADGTFALEDIRNGHYWTKFHYKVYSNDDEDESELLEEHDTDWIQVPDNLVINEPNKNGVPAVWYGINPNGTAFIRCYAPGGKA